MPKKSTNYENTVIYKIQHIEKDDLLYVGSTTDFINRKCSHKSRCNNPSAKNYNLKLYQTIRSNGGWDSFTMVVIKQFPCCDKRQAQTEEDRLMRELKASLNMNSAIFDKSKLSQINLKYRESHHESRNKYYEEHKVDLLNYSQRYHEEHKQEIKEKISELVQCRCGSIVRRCEISKLRHQQSNKHQKGIISLEKAIQ
jgi:hypothetical protein